MSRSVLAALLLLSSLVACGGDDADVERVSPDDWEVVSEGASQGGTPDLGVSQARIEELQPVTTSTSMDQTAAFDVVGDPTVSTALDGTTAPTPQPSTPARSYQPAPAASPSRSASPAPVATSPPPSSRAEIPRRSETPGRGDAPAPDTSDPRTSPVERRSAPPASDPAAPGSEPERRPAGTEETPSPAPEAPGTEPESEDPPPTGSNTSGVDLNVE